MPRIENVDMACVPLEETLSRAANCKDCIHAAITMDKTDAGAKGPYRLAIPA